MNWMIGGVYGDLYRIAMGDRREGAQLDEWEIERRMGEANTHSSSQDGRYWHRVATFAKRFRRLSGSCTGPGCSPER